MDLDIWLRREILGHNIVEEYSPSVLEHDSDGRRRKLYGARRYNHGGSTQLGISATENKRARVYRGAFPRSFPSVDPRNIPIQYIGEPLGQGWRCSPERSPARALRELGNSLVLLSPLYPGRDR